MNKYLLKSKIVASGMTQEEVAKKISISGNSLSNKINGKTLFNTKEIVELCKILSINDLKEKVDIFLSNITQ